MPADLPPQLISWLRRANQHAIAPRLLLSGSTLIATLCADARVPQDIDYLVVGVFDRVEMTRTVKEIVAIPDDVCELRLIGTEQIFEYSDEFPGIRAELLATLRYGQARRLSVDFAFGDPLSTPPRALNIEQVGAVSAVASETLFAWKLHTLIQFGEDEWRPKDLYDMEVLSRQCDLDPDILREAIELAFSSRYSVLEELHAFRTQPDWGMDTLSQTNWQEFQHQYKVTSSIEAIRTPLRSLLDEIL
jgi:hypothetical protein